MMKKRVWLLGLFLGAALSLAGVSWGFSTVELKEVAFSYRPEVEPFFLIERGRMRDASGGAVNPQQEVEIYEKLYQQKGDDMDLTHWESTGATDPQVFRVRVKVRNHGNEVSTPTPVTIRVFAKVGEFLTDPKTYLVNVNHLNATADWMEMEKIDGEIPRLAPGETLDWFSNPVAFGAFLNALQNQYPVTLRTEVQIDSPQAMNKAMSCEIPVKADHFALQFLRQSKQSR